jgi:superfamily I DNA and/or RNA helicase
VARAANIVFATTNSGELERLIDERGQCDWAIVEEAGKATGSELVSPMLLSHRRLMIGDHKQLPPFGSDQMIELLKNPHTVKEALLVGEEFVGRSLRDATTEEILDEVEEEGEIDDDAIPSLCAEALRVFKFFENTIESEFARQKRAPRGRPIAKRLNQQHRMRPEIATLVSRCFYSGDLTSHPECVARYKTQPPPFSSSDLTRLPSSPIVVIDMPYVQSAIGSQVGERFPRWNNPAEVRAVLTALDLICANATAAKKPTLAILSPYSQQVRRLSEAVRDVPTLTQFSPPTHSGVWCHTVDSFQGGEADLVVISLVRNNGHSNIQSAFGFLSDIRRMNVLLSRARWQLILVASLDFIREVLAAVRGADGAQQVQFMEEILKAIDDGKQNGSVSIIPLDRLYGRTQ